MAQGNNSERIKEALQQLQQSRDELSAEARWLRTELSPSRVVHRTVDNHTTSLLVTAFVVGLGGAWLLFHKRSQPKVEVRYVNGGGPVAETAKKNKGVIGALMGMALPLAFRYVTSKPVLTKIMNYAMGELGKRAQRQAANRQAQGSGTATPHPTPDPVWVPRET